MLVDSTPVSVWAPYPVFTTDGVVWSATKTKLHGTHATDIGGPIATAKAKRNDVFDGVANDSPAVFQDISAVVTVVFAPETIVMAVATGEDDTMETITVQPSTVTQAIPAGVTMKKREETIAASGNGTTVSPAGLTFNPITTTSITESVTSVVSQPVVSLTLHALENAC